MPEFKLIATDLDDTLLDDNLKISQRTRDALKRAKATGIAVTIATGRMYRSALPFVLDLGIDVPVITYQGAFVKNALSEEVLINRPIPLELAKRVLQAGYDAGVHMNIYLDDRLYVDSITPEGTGYANLAQVEMVQAGNLIEFIKDGPTKILYIAEPELLDELQKELKAQFTGDIYITKSKPQYLEFMNFKATKKTALQELAALFGVKREEIIAFGDSYNDLDMIEYAGLGVAMGNAPEEVKIKADLIADTNNNDGVAKVIESYVLK